jgi:AP-3 complex subunit delta-1
LERQRDDPYYVGSKAAKQNEYDEEEDNDDIDSIPIVHLSLNLPPPVTRRASAPRSPTPPPVHIDIDGEMPEGNDHLAINQSEPEVIPPITPIVIAGEGEDVKTDNIASEGAVLKVVKKKKKESKDGSLTPKPKKKKSTVVTLD